MSRILVPIGSVSELNEHVHLHRGPEADMHARPTHLGRAEPIAHHVPGCSPAQGLCSARFAAKFDFAVHAGHCAKTW